MWSRADSEGYHREFSVYTGKRKEKGLGLGKSVIEKLSRALNGKSYKIYADNFFSTVPLANFLKEKETGYCGTIRSSRKHVLEMKKDKDMKRGDLDWRMDPSGVSITKWMDNKAVHFISNMHDPSLQENTTRKNKDGTTITVECNQVNKDYNKHMGYVDKADMLKSLYGLDRKSKKWWHRIAFHFLDATVVNAFVIFKCIHEITVPLKKFKLSLIHGL